MREGRKSGGRGEEEGERGESDVRDGGRARGEGGSEAVRQETYVEEDEGGREGERE